MSTDALTVPAPPAGPYVRIVPLGGCGEIGRNMTVIETNDDLVVVDCGLMFPDDEMYGVDIVINDFTYVRERARQAARAAGDARPRRPHRRHSRTSLSEFPERPDRRHAADDRADQGEVARAALGEASFTQVQPGSRVALRRDRSRVHPRQSLGRGRLRARVAHAGRHDLSYRRLQIRSDADRRQARRLRARSRGSATRACSACSPTRTNAERPGHTLSERIVGEAFTSIFSHAKGRIVVASFASNVPRIQQTVDHAVRFDRKIAFLGRSMRNVVHFAGELGHLRIPGDT